MPALNATAASGANAINPTGNVNGLLTKNMAANTAAAASRRPGERSGIVRRIDHPKAPRTGWVNRNAGNNTNQSIHPSLPGPRCGGPRLLHSRR